MIALFLKEARQAAHTCFLSPASKHMFVQGVYLAPYELAMQCLRGTRGGFQINATLNHVTEHDRCVRLLFQEFGAHALRWSRLHAVYAREGFPGTAWHAQPQKDQSFVKKEQRAITLHVVGGRIFFRLVWKNSYCQLQEL